MKRSSNPSLHPHWAIVHRTPGTELKKIKDKFYLYGVKSVYDKTSKKAKKVSLGIIGSITEKEGLIPSNKAQLKQQINSAITKVSKVLDKEYAFRFL